MNVFIYAFRVFLEFIFVLCDLNVFVVGVIGCFIVFSWCLFWLFGFFFLDLTTKKFFNVVSGLRLGAFETFARDWVWVFGCVGFVCD